MIEIRTCPVCDAAGPRRLKTHNFQPPAGGPTGRSSRGGDRVSGCLDILFDRVIPGADSVDVSVDMCTRCGFVFANPRFTAAEIEAKYAALGSLEAAGRSRQSEALHTLDRSRRIHRLISSRIGLPRGLRVLDYGGAEGYNLQAFAEENHCFVLDFIEYPVRAQGVTYLGKDLSELEADARFDIILLSHVLEHAVEPTGLVRRLAGFLASGGILYLEVPLGVTSEWRRVREPLTHVNYFSEQSASRCVGEAGLSLLAVSTDYQWVLRSRTWIVEAIGRKGTTEVLKRSRVRSTRRQMLTPYYYLPAVTGYLSRRVKSLRVW